MIAVLMKVDQFLDSLDGLTILIYNCCMKINKIVNLFFNFIKLNDELTD